MDVLSNAQGSAQAVREAAASEAVDSRMALERELDRLNEALGTHAATAAQHLNWTLLAQAFLLTSYLIVLVGGWSVPLPGKRWLLGAIVGYGAISLVLGYLSQRGSRDRLAPLRNSRRLVEEALERVASRPTVFSRERVLVTMVGDWATRLLPVMILAGWAALTLYTLALPIPGEGRAVADARSDARAAASTVPATPRARAPGRKAEESASAAAPAPANSEENESGLAALFRRAINTPAVESSGETVKP
ncbi:MAG: hypothetical protein WBA53_00670 [Burkholderiaceae bacterium]